MKTRMFSVVAITVTFAASIGVGMSQTLAPPSDQKSLSSTLGVYTFPTAGQKADQQSKDEGECNTWAVQNSGVDPFHLAKQTEQQMAQANQNAQAAATAGQGSAAKGTVGGAATGAVVGAIAGDAGKGAAIGAGAGLLAGGARKRGAKQQAEAQAQQQVQQTQKYSKEQMEKFKKAFSVCLEAKKYMVKY